MLVCPPSSDPIAHGLPASSAPACGELFLPFRKLRPIGCMGGRYRTSNPIDATYGSQDSQSRRVPGRLGSGEVERGNNSYQVEKRAFSRSTTTASSLSYCAAE